MSNENLEILEVALESVSSKVIKKKIRDFELNYKNYREEEVREKIKDVIFFRSDIFPTRVGAVMVQEKKYLPGGIFYRAREVESFDCDFFESDFWAPENSLVEKHGRFNKPNQSLLYTSEGLVETAFSEVGVTKENRVLLIAYQAKEEIFALNMNNKFSAEISSFARKKLRIIRGFINRNLLSSGSGSYLFSNEISNLFSDISPDGWSYPSVAKSGGTNMCFRTEAQRKLKINEIFAFHGSVPVGYFKIKGDGEYGYCDDALEAASRFKKFIMSNQRTGNTNDLSTREDRKNVSIPTIIVK